MGLELHILHFLRGKPERGRRRRCAQAVHCAHQVPAADVRRAAHRPRPHASNPHAERQLVLAEAPLMPAQQLLVPSQRLLTAFGRSQLNGWTEPASTVTLVSDHDSTTDFVFGAVGAFEKVLMKFSHLKNGAVAANPTVRAQDMLADSAVDVSAKVSYDAASKTLTLPGALLRTFGTAEKSRDDDVSAPGAVFSVSFKSDDARLHLKSDDAEGASSTVGCVRTSESNAV